MNKSTFEEELERTGRLVYTNLGNSMMPLIRQQKDLVIIKQAKEPLKRYDVPLYLKFQIIGSLSSHNDPHLSPE